MKNWTRNPVHALVPAMAALCMAHLASAQTPATGNPVKPLAAPSSDESASRSVVEWLQRMHTASRQHSYIGTFVVSVAAGSLSSARIWHACEGDLQIERVEALSGPPRSTFRRNDQVLTFLPDQRVVKSEKRENLELFPNLLGMPDSSIADYYTARVVGKGRVAGFDTDVVQLMPRDAMRFGYRIWTEKQTGLLTKLQTIDSEGRVVEQSAFSELQLDAPVKVQALSQMMGSTMGFRMEKPDVERTTAAAEGWTLKNAVPGFKPISCYRRAMGAPTAPQRTLQWTFSDGLATVSLFVEPYDAQRGQKEALLAMGATNTLTKRLADNSGEWWLTVVGEVPPQTLEAFAQNIARVAR
ncbi:MucB/RseB C-terminal domain-containing protein [Variovorax sp. J22R133]|uniref:MucB/RseB C-terminal domain-containing protein n=1 Tax=Variovorax brevis TaxID=3053503 RepID=UPI002575CD03|nr:MucB/RseB C-terminal domain-containing protein [Variovorax sp. J22R133]MDM0114311.1 MucB/RseB C-terminal domain-containing protein [Variovorax sp. J22R133]